jgi:hypothetical protein
MQDAGPVSTLPSCYKGVSGFGRFDSQLAERFLSPLRLCVDFDHLRKVYAMLDPGTHSVLVSSIDEYQGRSPSPDGIQPEAIPAVA